ncbi:MAG TPA: cystathionine gamma-synthase family protein [Polyangiaceae bacterium]|nr:cystathionine gamma-synthase family protein [Polyangiaceae bacterium]
MPPIRRETMKRSHSDGDRPFNPETLALGYGFDPWLSEGSIKPPVFLTSTFQFRSAAEGKAFFEVAYGLRDKRPNEAMGLIYSRLNNPNLEMFENRMAAWDETEEGAVFASGMAAISTSMLALLEPGDHVIYGAPVYGGTHFLLHHVLPRYGISAHQVLADTNAHEVMRAEAEAIGKEKVRLLFVETPANPTLAMVDIAEVSRLGRELGRADRPCLTAVDNTFLGPVFQRPAHFGADLVMYSATKFIGGHSDLIAGVVTGSKEHVEAIKLLRTILGTMATPFNGWLLLRSLETVSVRMRRQAKSARLLAAMLAEHPRVAQVDYPTLWSGDDPRRSLYERQCTGPGSLIAFDVKGGEDAAFRVLDRFEVARLAVSLGGTETLVEHPRTMTHSDVPPEELDRLGVGESMIRVSVGIEHLSDLRRDFRHALAGI